MCSHHHCTVFPRQMGTSGPLLESELRQLDEEVQSRPEDLLLGTPEASPWGPVKMSS